MSAPLSILHPPARLTVTGNHESFAQLDCVSQVTRAFSGNPLAALLGFAFGGLIPLVTYVTIHAPDGVDSRPILWLIAGGGLLYSASTVFTWANAVFGSWIKAGAFVCLTESAMALEHTEWIAFTVLALLILVNGVACSIALQVTPDGDVTTPDANTQILGLNSPHVQVNVMQHNSVTPLTLRRTDAERRAADAERARRYRAKRKQATQAN